MNITYKSSAACFITLVIGLNKAFLKFEKKIIIMKRIHCHAVEFI